MFQVYTTNDIIPDGTMGVSIHSDITDLSSIKLPDSVTVISLDGDYFRELKKVDLPPFLSELQLCRGYNHELCSNEFPLSLTCLDMNIFGSYNIKLTKNSLPVNLEKLTFSYKYDHDLESDVFPDTLEHLILADKYARAITKNSLPKYLKVLEHNFCPIIAEDDPKEIFPKSIEKISSRIKRSYGIMDGSYPTNIKCLTISNKFINKGPLPCLRELKMPYEYFNHDPDFKIPDTVVNLCVTECVKEINQNIFPRGLEKLSIYFSDPHAFTYNCFPPNLRYLKIHGVDRFDENSFPRKLVGLTIDTISVDSLRSNILPSTLKSLTIAKLPECILDRDFLPRNLECLKITCTAGIDLSIIPDTVEYLRINFIKPFNSDFMDMQYLPSNLKYIDVRREIEFLIRADIYPPFSVIFDGHLKLSALNKIKFPFLVKEKRSIPRNLEIINRITHVRGKKYVTIINPETFVPHTHTKSARF